MPELVNELSWSKSRHGKLEECPRLYWLHYYGAWGGWKDDASPAIREAYVLKNLSSRQQWAGHKVHEAVAFALSMARCGEAPGAQALVRRVHDQMREEFRRSRGREYRRDPKRIVGLVEHELDEPLPDSEWRANWESVEGCLRRFCASRWPELARGLGRGDWLPIDEIASFALDGVKVFAGPDFAFRDAGRTVVVDWKTGRAHAEDAEQMRGYALFAQARWGAQPESVRAILVYLARGEEVEVEVSPGALEEFRARFARSVARMRGLLRDPRANLAAVEDFPMTEDRSRCRACAFQRRCER